MQKLLLLLIFGSVHSDEFTENITCPALCQCSILYDSTTCRGQQLSSVPSDVRPEVKILDLTDNLFSVVPVELVKYQTLYHLILAKNQITRLTARNLNIKSLRILDVSHNKIRKWSDIHSNAINITSVLEELNLSYNPIRYINQPTYLASTSLQVLKMQGCSLVYIPELFLTKLTKLNSFIISGNDLGDRVIQLKSDTVETLDVSYCSLEQINLTKLPGLKFVNLTGNYISKILPRYFNSEKLQVLDLYNNTIKSIDKNAFNNLPAMETLNLSTNTFTHLHPETFGYNKMLKTLKLSRTYMTQLVRFNISTLETLDFSVNEIQYFTADDLKLMPSLKYLNLDKNLITRLPRRIISNSLLHLDLSTCKITDITNETFAYLPNLQELYIAGNRLTGLKPTYLPNNLKEITLFNNPWRCECHSNEFHDLFNYVMRLQIKISGEHRLLCQSPENVSGYPWELACHHVWYRNSSFAHSDRLWLYIILMILTMSLIFCTTISMKRIYRAKLLREQQERERQRLEAQARMRRLRQQQRQSIQAQQNAPDPRELVRPPSYAEAILLPRIGDSNASLAGSQHSLSASNSNLAKKKRRRRAKESAEKSVKQRSREVKVSESEFTEGNEQGTSSQRTEFDRQTTVDSEDDLETDEDVLETRIINLTSTENNESRS
ncbi:uncharacterized protein CBL_13859 [Carabus blaptoides fortunei]